MRPIYKYDLEISSAFLAFERFKWLPNKKIELLIYIFM